MNLVNALDILSFAFQTTSNSQDNVSCLSKIDSVVQKIRLVLTVSDTHKIPHKITINSLKRCAKRALHSYKSFAHDGSKIIAGHPYEYETLKAMVRV